MFYTLIKHRFLTNQSARRFLSICGLYRGFFLLLHKNGASLPSLGLFVSFPRSKNVDLFCSFHLKANVKGFYFSRLARGEKNPPIVTLLFIRYCPLEIIAMDLLRRNSQELFNLWARKNVWS